MVNSGGGVLSASLAKYFDHVAVSDPGESNVALARAILQPSSQFTIKRASGEESWLPPASMDFVAMGECLHFMYTEPALAAAAASLKSGGTFAAVFYSAVLYFPQDARLATLMQEMQCESFTRFFANDVRLQEPNIKAAPPRTQRGYNGIELPDETGEFKDWTRVNINLHGRSDVEAFKFWPEESFPIPASQVKDSEKVLDLDDKSWGKEVDVDFVKGFLGSLTLPYDQRCWELPSWVEFERIINQEFGGKVTAEWPVSMILGSKK